MFSESTEQIIKSFYIQDIENKGERFLIVFSDKPLINNSYEEYEKMKRECAYYMNIDYDFMLKMRDTLDKMIQKVQNK